MTMNAQYNIAEHLKFNEDQLKVKNHPKTVNEIKLSVMIKT